MASLHQILCQKTARLHHQNWI